MLRRGRSILCRHTTEGGDQAGRPRLVSASTAYALIAASAQRPGESRWQGQAMNAWPAAWMRRNAAYTVAARAALKSNIPVVRRYRGAAALSARAMCISAGRLARGQRPLPVVVNNVVLFNKSGSARDMMGNNWTWLDFRMSVRRLFCEASCQGRPGRSCWRATTPHLHRRKPHKGVWNLAKAELSVL
eukprot:COSAG03_NODE_972_length_5142_cov_3.351576_6_plen_188_part_00